MPIETCDHPQEAPIEGTFTFEDGQTVPCTVTFNFAPWLRNLWEDCFGDAQRGMIQRKPESAFSEKEGYLPLDLWDSTPDP